MSDEKIDRRKLLVLGATSVVLPACSAGGADPSFWEPGGVAPPGTGGSGTGGSPGTSTGSGTSTGPGTTNGSSSSSSSSGSHTTTASSSSSSGETTSSSSSSSSGKTTSSSSSSSSAASSSSSGGPTCPTVTNSKRLAFSSYPQLQNTGGSVVFQGSSYSDPYCGQPDIIVLSKGGGQYVAFSASCGHQCCTVKYSSSQFHCPCHGANFNATTGDCTNGVSPTPLAQLKVCADATGVTVSW